MFKEKRIDTDESEPAEKPPSNCVKMPSNSEFTRISAHMTNEEERRETRDDLSIENKREILFEIARLQFEMVSFSAVLFIFSLTYTASFTLQL